MGKEYIPPIEILDLTALQAELTRLRQQVQDYETILRDAIANSALDLSREMAQVLKKYGKE